MSAVEVSFKRGVNLKFFEAYRVLKLPNYYCNVYKRVHLWNGNESENPFLISNFTKNDDF